MVTVTIQEAYKGTVGDRIQAFELIFPTFMKHIFNFRQQYRYFKERRQNLGPNERLVHVGLSENFNCKMAKEVQAMNSGAYGRQISLHTGVYYIRNEKANTFCTISDELHHGPGAI